MSKPKQTPAFKKAYQALNRQQKQAVETIDGPVMVVAGPGTGKTQTIALRIANILRSTDTDPSSILALTFTESGARAMRTRLATFIGTPAYYVEISTFHSFCVKVMKDHPDNFFLDPSAEPLSDLEKLKIIYELIDKSNFNVLRPLNSHYHYARAIIGALSDLKREGVSPEKFAEILGSEQAFLKSDEGQSLKKLEFNKRTKDLKKNLELSVLYHAYQHELISSQRFDFEDMVNSVIDAFERLPDVLSSYQELYQYLLIDEYQDTNNAQNKLLLQLASYWGEDANIMVTGDPDQCLPGDTLIATKNGSVQIKNIKENDNVLSAVGKGYTAYIPVKRVYKNKRKVKLITLTLESGQVITSTHNHKMFCFIPPREQTNYWYVYLMYKKDLGWRIGTTIGLAHRLKLEGDADKIVGIRQCDSNDEARYYETYYSLKYQIPMVVFKARGNLVTGDWLIKLYSEFDTIKNSERLASELGINLNEPHYQRDGTTFGKGRTKINLYMNSRSYKSKYSKNGLLQSPSVTHELDIQTKNTRVLKILEEKGFQLRNQKIGKGLRLVSHDLTYLYKLGKELEKDLDGILDIKSSLGTKSVQHKPTRIMQAGNVLVGNYLPVLDGYFIKYSKVIKKEEECQEMTVYDLEIYPSHNFVANGVVVHNSIMRFQGASIENQLSFIKNFPAATVITLHANYRSTQTILDAANSLISHNNLRINDVVKGIDPHLTSVIGAGSKIKEATLSTALAETIYLAQDIKKKLASGVPAGEIAVIYRNNADSKLISDTFAKYGIDYLVQGGANVLEDPTIRNFLKILQVIYEMRKREEDEDLFTILHYDIFGIDPLDVLKLSRLAGDNRLSLFDVLADHHLIDSLVLTSKDKLQHALDQLTSWSAFDAENTFTATFEEILSKSGYLKWILGQVDSHHRLARMNTVFEEVKKMNRFDHSLDLKKFLENIKLMQENNLRLEEDTFGVSKSAVTLTTAHKAKGLEWEHVYLYKSIDGVWGNNKTKDLLKLPEGVLASFDESRKEKNEDERRLFYVALTRAKSNLTLTRAGSYSSSGVSRESVPTMFISEMGDSYIEDASVQAVEEFAHSHLEKVLSSGGLPNYRLEEETFLNTLIDNFSLSVTALNTFLECAYKFKLDKLYKVPHSKKPHLAFGTAVHKSLENFYSQLKESGTLPNKDYLLSEFRSDLSKEVISKKDHAERLIEGEKILSTYYDFYHKEFHEPLFLEKFFRVKLDDLPAGEGINLTGKIDRIEMISQTDRTVRVVDYKTGKGKTVGQIEGSTQDSQGDLKRQLVFYKLLIELDKRLNNLEFGEAMLDFVSVPSEKGKDGRFRLLVTDDEVTDLKGVIRKVLKEIRAHHFPRTDNLKSCEKCYFLTHCYPDGLPIN